MVNSKKRKRLNFHYSWCFIYSIFIFATICGKNSTSSITGIIKEIKVSNMSAFELLTGFSTVTASDIFRSLINLQSPVTRYSLLWLETQFMNDKTEQSKLDSKVYISTLVNIINSCLPNDK